MTRLRYLPALAIVAGLTVLVFWSAPRCAPGDPGLIVGGMLMAGCR